MTIHMQKKLDKNVRVKKAIRLGGASYLAMTGLIEEGRHYSVRKINNRIIIEDIEDFV